MPSKTSTLTMINEGQNIWYVRQKWVECECCGQGRDNGWGASHGTVVEATASSTGPGSFRVIYQCDGASCCLEYVADSDRCVDEDAAVAEATRRNDEEATKKASKP